MPSAVLIGDILLIIESRLNTAFRLIVIRRKQDGGPFNRPLAFINNDELYLITYIATAIFYFDKHWDEALAIMESANVSAVAES